MKNKIVGLANIFFGFIEGLVQVGILIAQPRILDMYRGFNIQPPFITQILPFISVLLIGLMFFVVYVGIKLLRVKGKNEKLFSKGIICLIVAIVLNVLNIFFIGNLYTILLSFSSYK